VFATGFNQNLRSSNFTERIQAAGLNAPAETNYNYDTSFSSGGPILRDRLWYFTQTYYRGSSSDISMFFNKNAGDITKWTYEADPTRQAKNVGNGPLQPNLRLTVQLSRRDKLNLFWDEQISNNSIGQGSSTTAPETGSYNHGWQRVQQVKWTSTATNSLLLEAGLGTYLSNWNGRERPGNDRRMIQVVEQCTQGCPANGGQALTYRGQATWNADWIGAHTWNAAASYITGTHNMKFGYQGAFHVDDRNAGGVPLTYRVNNGVPNRFTQQIRDYETAARVRYNAFYAQDSWTRQRLTLSGGIRYDNAWDFYPEQQIGGTTFLPEVTFFSSSKGVEGYHDVTPRMGAVYDLFGNGKTALKFNAGRYLEAAVNANGNYSGLVPANRIIRTSNRTWTDANNNFVVDCNLYDQNQNDFRPAGGDFCGQGDLNFGKSVPTLFYDPAVMKGWGVRPADWQVGVTVQHEILPRVSLEVGYSRRWLQNFTVTDNQLTTPADYGTFSITAPLDDRLPNGGGYVIDGLFNVNPDKSGQTINYRTYAPNYGKQYSIYNGLELSVQARLASGLQLQAGSSTGETVTDNCEIRAKVPEISLLDPFCHNAPGITTRATGAATYTIPKIDVLLGATFQSSPAGSLSADWAITAAGAPAQWAAIQQQLGRPLSANATSITVDLLQPGELRGERVNQIDFRVGKRLRYGRMRSTLSVDMYNLLNPDTVLGNSSTFIPGITTGLSAWNRPTSVMTPRTVKITLQHDF
jgi:hypothetical protein